MKFSIGEQEIEGKLEFFIKRKVLCAMKKIIKVNRFSSIVSACISTCSYA